MGGASGVPANSSSDLLKSLEEMLDPVHRRGAEARAGRLEAALRPIYSALPKNSFGSVTAATARYALHRLFVQQHGWQLQGLEPSGAKWADASPMQAFGGQLPKEAQSALEAYLSTRGFDLRELALVAAMLEHSVHGEAEGRMIAVWKALELPRERALKADRVGEVVDLYMACYVLGVNASKLSRSGMEVFWQKVIKGYPSWIETVSFLRQVQQEVRPGRVDMSFGDVVAIVEEATDRYGRWQTKECTALKGELVELEDRPGSGRVRLTDFYNDALHGGNWQFSEKPEYLQQLGALDDSDPSAPRVLIANYIYSPSNCLTTLNFYAVCCIDECEGLMAHLEFGVGQPDATPEEIIALVKSQPLGALPGNWTPTASLLRRLSDVAEHHGGRVPLHGRLFAQWLHYAFPRECPFPHVSGVTNPQRSEQWRAATGERTTMTKEQMAQHIEKAAAAQSGQRQAGAQEEEADVESDMWTMEEELVAEHSRLGTADAPGQPERTKLRVLALLAAAASLLIGLARMMADASGGPAKPQRYSV